METPKNISTIKTRTSSKWLGHDNILRIRFYKVSSLDIADAMTDVGVITEIANGTAYPIIIDVSQLRRISLKTTQYIREKKDYKCITKAAFIVNTGIFGKLINKTPQNFSIPGIESKCVKSEAEAIEWINS